MTLRALLWIALCGVMACSRPTLWLGEVARDGDEPRVQPIAGMAAPVRDAATTMPPDLRRPQDSGELPPALDAGPQTSAPIDAGGGVDASIADEDAGSESPPIQDPWPELPPTNGKCPTLKGNGMYTFGDPQTRTLPVRIFIAPDARDKPEPGGPLILYWHAKDTAASEVFEGLGQAQIDDVVTRGGVVAAFESKLCTNCPILEIEWYAIDDSVSDQVVACAVEQAHIDPRRIHSMGFSAGALHTMHLALARSNYLASVVAYSGGGTDIPPERNQNPTHKVPSLQTFGSTLLDIVEINFNALSRDWADTYRRRGWYTMFCEHSAGHVIPREFPPLAYRFLMDHPFKVSPDPYAAAIPDVFPSYCVNEPAPR